METIILIERPQRSTFAEALKKKYHVECVSSGKAAVETAQRFPALLAIILDSISMRTTGERIAKQVKSELANVPLIHLCEDAKAANGAVNGAAGTPAKDGATSHADVVLIPPFTARKLVNIISRLAPGMRPANTSDSIVKVGPFAVNVTQRLLIVNGQETALTPKEALLAAYFLRHPGETLDRKQLMEQVWQTDYLGDTRTLDVHVRWIRRMIEADPGKPVYLKTVRGVGYRLDVPTETEPVRTAHSAKKASAKAEPAQHEKSDTVKPTALLVDANVNDASTAAVLQNS